jgi:hypothetical protein
MFRGGRKTRRDRLNWPQRRHRRESRPTATIIAVSEEGATRRGGARAGNRRAGRRTTGRKLMPALTLSLIFLWCLV